MNAAARGEEVDEAVAAVAGHAHVAAGRPDVREDDAAGGALAREALAFADKLVCFRFAERIANESPYRQDDVRWALAFHEALELKLEEDPDRTWHRDDDWTQLAARSLGLDHDLREFYVNEVDGAIGARQVIVDLARLMYVGAAARQIARGRGDSLRGRRTGAPGGRRAGDARAAAAGPARHGRAAADAARAGRERPRARRGDGPGDGAPAGRDA